MATAFEQVMPEVRASDGVVIDLRGNPGGVAAIAQGVAGHFVAQTISLGTMKGRRDQLELVAEPRLVARDGRKEHGCATEDDYASESQHAGDCNQLPTTDAGPTPNSQTFVEVGDGRLAFDVARANPEQRRGIGNGRYAVAAAGLVAASTADFLPASH